MNLLFFVFVVVVVFVARAGYSPTSDPSCIPEEGVEVGVSGCVSGDGGQWLRFNDVLVDEFSMSYSALVAECFGGTYKPKPSECEFELQRKLNLASYCQYT